MKIINGRWVVDDNLTPIDERTSPAFVELGKKVESIYGDNITHDRIKLVSQLNDLNNQDERILLRLIDEGHLNKLIGV
jgi:hypothetical protein